MGRVTPGLKADFSLKFFKNIGASKTKVGKWDRFCHAVGTAREDVFGQFHEDPSTPDFRTVIMLAVSRSDSNTNEDHLGSCGSFTQEQPLQITFPCLNSSDVKNSEGKKAVGGGHSLREHCLFRPGMFSEDGDVDEQNFRD